MPTKFFGTVTQKIFDGRLWYPLLCIKFFDTPNFLKHWRDAHEIFRHCETKKLRRKIVILPPPPYPNFFDARNYCNSKGFPYGNFRHCERKNFRWKILILPPPPLIQTFSIPEINETLKDSPPPTEIFGTVRQKIFDGKFWYPLPPLWCIKFFATRNFLIHRSVPQRNFSVLWDKKFWTKSRA